MRHVQAILLTALTLTACDGGGDPVQQALRETAAANHSAAVKETATTAAIDSASVDREWVAKMIEQHHGAVAVANLALARAQDPEIRRMAQATKDARTREIAELQAWKLAATSGQ